ncbi:MAG TPA: hypothetical protein VET83_07865 [Candidatus Dormibacteraeota bacterium]|nr:hypothetical protein [Candidatus Dormibacteraeota bacterium]
MGVERLDRAIGAFWQYGASGEIRYMNDFYHLDPPVLAALDSSGRS